MRSQQQRRSGRKQRDAIKVLKKLALLIQDFVSEGKIDKSNYEKLVNEIAIRVDGYLERNDG